MALNRTATVFGVCKSMSKKKKAKGPDFVVKKAIQDFARKNNMMVGSDAYDAVNEAIGKMMKDAAGRCKANKRKTLKAYDF
jgi:histone H3/H4